MTIAKNQVRVDGVTITMFAAGIIAVVLGIACFRLMDDRPDVPLRTDVVAAMPAGTGRSSAAARRPACSWSSKVAREPASRRRYVGSLPRCRLSATTSSRPSSLARHRSARSCARCLLDRGNTAMAPLAEAMLYAADRAQHVAEVVRPAMERGAVVISDRYVDSSIAYQSGGRGLSESDIRRMSAQATGGLRPDLTVLLDVSPDVGLARVTGGGDRIEAEAVEFHQRVRRTFLALASQRRSGYLVLDAAKDADALHEVIVARGRCSCCCPRRCRRLRCTHRSSRVAP